MYEFTELEFLIDRLEDAQAEVASLEYQRDAYGHWNNSMADDLQDALLDIKLLKQRIEVLESR